MLSEQTFLNLIAFQVYEWFPLICLKMIIPEMKKDLEPAANKNKQFQSIWRNNSPIKIHPQQPQQETTFTLDDT